MKIIEIDNYPDFFNLKESWNEVLLKSNCSVFSTWEWLSTWWKHFGSGKRLLLLLAEENGETIGIAPLMYSVHSMFGLRQAKIEFIGAPDLDYNDFILTEKREDCVKMFMHHLTRISENWDCIDLRDIPETAFSLSILRKISNRVEFAEELALYECPSTPLPASSNAYLLSLPRKHRKELNRNVRVVEKEGMKLDFVDRSDVQSVKDGMSAFFELHQKRWTRKKRSGIFSDQKICDFHMDLARLLAQNGWLGLYFLEFSDKPVAALYGFKYRSKYYAYLSGFDPQYSKYGVGSLLFMFAINRCIQEELVEFDFLRGSETYKGRWNTTARWNYEAILTKKGLWADIENWLYKEYWRQGNRLKHILENAPTVLRRMN